MTKTITLEFNVNIKGEKVSDELLLDFVGSLLPDEQKTFSKEATIEFILTESIFSASIK